MPLETLTLKSVEVTAFSSLSELHPLEPLSAEEIAAAVALLRGDKRMGDQMRFVSVSLQEPDKQAVARYEAGEKLPREAMVGLLDNSDGTAVEIVVSLSAKTVLSWEHIPGVQTMLLSEEAGECEELCKADPEFQLALARRGVQNLDLVMVEAWPAGTYWGEHNSKRLAHGLVWVRKEAGDNGFAYPAEGLSVLIDLNAGRIVRVMDSGVVPFPPESGNYNAASVPEFRTGLKPIEITQPEGPSFSVSGHRVQWQKWDIRFGFTPREGLVLHTVGYEENGKVRPILYRASLSEMIVPYGDPTDGHFRKNAFDVGEYGIGLMANSLELGCDCLGEIHYFDAPMVDCFGEVMNLKNAVCMHEEDFGILWKHTEWRTGEVVVRRSRRLVLSFISTVGNYEYGFFWYFYQDGSIQMEVKLTGCLITGALSPGEATPVYGTLIAPQLYAPSHQHFFNLRLDMTVDGISNTVQEVNTEAVPIGPDNPNGNGFVHKSISFKRESEAIRRVNADTARYWKISNPNVLNRLGVPVAYKLAPGENCLPFAHPESSVMKRAPFLSNHLYVTPYAPAEIFASGDYPNQHQGGTGLATWAEADRPIENTDVIVWYTMGHHHVPRPEDWPVMPCAYMGFHLKPVGFFDKNPGWDVPPSTSNHCQS